MEKDKKIKIRNVAGRLLVLWLIMAVSVTVHEAGHALVAVFSGGEVSYFSMSLLDARIRYNGELSTIQTSILNIAGVGLPVLLWFIFLMVVPANSKNIWLEYTKTYSLIIPASMLAWVFIPLLFIADKAPAGDDVTKFLQTSGINGYLVSLFFLALLALSFMLWKKKNPRAKKILLFRDQYIADYKPGMIPFVAFSVLFLVLMTFPWVNHESAMGRTGSLIFQTSLEGLEGEYEICKFLVEKEVEQIDVIVEMKNVSADLIQMWLTDPEGETTAILDSKGFTVGAGSQTVSLELKKSEYRIMLNAESIIGKMSIFLNRKR